MTGECDIAATLLVHFEQRGEVEVGHQIAEAEHDARLAEVDGREPAYVPSGTGLLDAVQSEIVGKAVETPKVFLDQASLPTCDDRDATNAAPHHGMEQTLDHRKTGHSQEWFGLLTAGDQHSRTSPAGLQHTMRFVGFDHSARFPERPRP
jgi:hypothetical protein